MAKPFLLNPSDLKQMMIQPPFASADRPGTGGVLKALPEHFQVEEVLPYAPCGEGEHVFVTLRRSGWNTVDVARALGRAFSLEEPDVGWGGRKDRHAVTTQTFSLHLPVSLPPAHIDAQLASLPFEIIAISRHRNKLKTGHVAANRFQIVLSQVGPDGLERAQAIAEVLKQDGLPNYYGEQRFGVAFGNLERAAALVQRGKAHGRKEAFMVSVLQSALFNCWLIARIQRGQFKTLLEGDVARKTDTGGLFIVEDLEEAGHRFASGRISYTGPIYGHKMMAAAGPAGVFENQLLQRHGLDSACFKSLRAPGSRRAAVLHPKDLVIKPVAEGLHFSFTLPAGAYATTLLREFTRMDGAAVAENELLFER
jgi:tRNA pseudouridine13 synthase